MDVNLFKSLSRIGYYLNIPKKISILILGMYNRFFYNTLFMFYQYTFEFDFALRESF